MHFPGPRKEVRIVATRRTFLAGMAALASMPAARGAEADALGDIVASFDSERRSTAFPRSASPWSKAAASRSPSAACAAPRAAKRSGRDALPGGVDVEDHRRVDRAEAVDRWTGVA